MELKVRSAKSVQVRGEMILAESGLESKLSMKIVLGEGDKIHIDVVGNLYQKAVKMTVVGDGNKVYMDDKIKGKVDISENIRGEGSFIRSVMLRGGVFMGLVASELGSAVKKLPNPDETFKVSDFKLLGKEKLGGRSVHVIQYKLAVKDRDTAIVKLWVDTESLLPAKLEADADKGKTHLIDNYSEFTLNGKVDPKLFEAPK